MTAKKMVASLEIHLTKSLSVDDMLELQNSVQDILSKTSDNIYNLSQVKGVSVTMSFREIK